MILTEKQINSILNQEGIYDCRLAKQQFAYVVLGAEVSPLGNVICFNAPVSIGPLFMNEALVLVGELPNTDMFGGISLLRLYLTQLGSLLSLLTGKDYYVEESSIFVDGAQASMSLSNKVKDSVVFHIIFPIQMQTEGVEFSLFGLDSALDKDFKFNAIESFSHLTNSIFVETRRDNF